MTTIVVKSEMDAALALLDLHGDYREHHYENYEIRTIAVGSMEGSTAIEGIISGFITQPTQLPHSSTPITPISPNENSNHHSKPVEKKVMCDKETQTELELCHIPVVDTSSTTIKQLCAKIESLKSKLKIQESEVVSISDSPYEGHSDISSEEYSPKQYRRKIYKRKRLLTSNTDFSSVGEHDSPFTKKPKKNVNTNEMKRTLKPNNMNKLNNEMVLLGDGNASVPARLLKHMDWSSYTNATRKLLTAVFSRKVLATHSLTGKPSPAFPDKPAKKKLDPAIVNDIVQTVVENCSVPENVVRTSITTKCADESKMFRTREQNKKKRKSVRKENISPSDSDNSYMSN